MAEHHTENTFHDPHADWVCGRDGAPCRFGPNARGHCAMRAECTPYQKDDRWECDRPVGRGGACEAGPLPDGSCCQPATPCLPRATPQRRVKTAWRVALVLSLGAAVLFFSWEHGLAPGPVAPAHSSFGDDCAQCHADVTASFAHIVAGALRGGRGAGNAEKCLACHGVGSAPLAAHGVQGLGADASTGDAGDANAVATTAAPLGVRAAAWFAPARLAHTGDAAQIPCNTCHREHEGGPVAPALTDEQCQVCHQSPFAGLAAHPEFAPWPHHQSPLIGFNHEQHLRRHFAEAKKDGATPPTQCVNCHHIGRTGDFIVRGFEETCASCHSAEITDPAGDTPFFTFLAPPGLDLEVLAAANIGAWPEYAEAVPNEFTRLLLATGGYLPAADWETVAALDLLDLTDATETERAAVARFAWAFKTLARDLADAGPSVFVQAAQNFAARGIGQEALHALAAALPFEVARDAVGQWFPGLAGELAAHAGGSAPPTLGVDFEADAAAPAAADDIEAWLRFGGWHAGYLALQYRPAGHADGFLHGWLEFADAAGAEGEALFALLAAKDTPGRCGKCHVREGAARGGATARLNWAARGSPKLAAREDAAGAQPWRRSRPFSHGSHQQAIARDGCSSCHALAGESTATASPTGFGALAVADCASCHRAAAELANCVTCHVYHFQNFAPALIEQNAFVKNALQ